MPDHPSIFHQMADQINAILVVLIFQLLLQIATAALLLVYLLFRAGRRK